MNEIWEDIYEYKNYYQISNFGIVKSLKRLDSLGKRIKEKILTPILGNHGYYYVNLSKKGKVKVILVHQLVAIAFLNHKSSQHKLVVDHIDFNRLNNRLDNLRIITNRENTNQKHLKSSSKYIGVSLKHNKYESNISINGNLKYLGRFINEYDAHLAYQKELTKINNINN